MNGSTRRLRRGLLTAALAIAAALGPATAALAAPVAPPGPPAAKPAAAAARHTTPVGGHSPATNHTRQVCGKPKPGYAACMSIRRTNVPRHLGLFAAGQAPSGYGPADLQSAYKLPSATAGAGATVAVVDAYDDPHAASDLAIYRKQYGLPACTTASGCFRKVNQTGGGTMYPTLDYSWSAEISLDLDMVSAICPKCHILLVEANSASDPDLETAEDTAVRLGAKYVSNSWAACAFPGETAEDASFDHPGVAVVAAAGDYGYGNEQQSCDTPSYPAGAPGVTSVGGTTLSRQTGSKRGWTESAWLGTGSGCDTFEPEPAWQTDTGCAGRTENDAAAVADPNTGVAVYDSVLGSGTGWGVLGGTSVATPIITSTYALAGKPIPGTTPASYPYADPSALNDVTSGTNGIDGCSPAYLCQARKGYDGPTGLGTPDGTAAFTRPHGTLSGTLTGVATGKPLAGALVQAGTGYARTNQAGHYTLTVPAGSYTVAALDFAGYATQTQPAVAVAAGQSVTQNFALTAAPDVTLSGTVTDGSGHGWPLYAKVTLGGLPVSMYTSPATGRYRLKVPQGSTFTVQASPVYPGYRQAQQTVSTTSSNTTQNLTAPINGALGCAAPGYQVGGTPSLSQTFSKTTIPAGWRLIKGNSYDYWQFNNAAGLRNDTGGTGNFAVAYAVAGLGDTSTEVLQSPDINLSANQNPVLTFDSANDYGTTIPQDQVDLSIDGGKTWTQAWTSGGVDGRVTLPLPQAAAQPTVRLRFVGKPAGVSNGRIWWEVDNVSVAGCVAAPGGLLTGRVGDANTGQGVTGAAVADGSQSASTVSEPGDPAHSGAYALFTGSTGAQTVTASATSYASASSSVNVAAGQVIQASFTLKAGRFAVSPASVTGTSPMGQRSTASFTVTNTGDAPAQLAVSSQPGGFTEAGPRAAGGQGAPRGTGAPVQRVPGHYSPLAIGPRAGDGGRAAAGQAPAVVPGSQWVGVRSYPVEVGDVAAATDPVTGDVYAAGGTIAGGDPPLNSAYMLDPHTGLWQRLPAMSHQREGAEAAFIGGKLYVAGGYGYQAVPVPGMEVYDTATRTWSAGRAIPHPYYGAASAVLDGKWYVVGGCDPYYGYCGENNVQVYNPATGTWRSAAAYPKGVGWLSCGAIGGKLYCAGGISDISGRTTAAGYSYDPASNKWSKIASLPISLWGSAYSVANGQLLVTGGITHGESVMTNQGYAYDPASDTWAALPNAPDAVYRTAGACGYYQIGGFYNDLQAGTEDDYQLPGYGDCGGDSWLSASPASSTLQPGQSEKVTVTLNAGAGSVSQPGVYTAALRVSGGTPYAAPSVPVTLTATPPKTWGKLAGTVKAQACGGTARPLPGGTVQVTGEAGSQVLTTDRSGRYAQWLDTSGNPFTVIVSAPGEQPQTARVTLRALATTTRNFTLTKTGGCG
jgi:hypothetical protein